MRRSEHRLQVRQNRRIQGAEILGAVMNVSAQHGLQRLGIKRRGARRQKALFLNVHGLESRIPKGLTWDRPKAGHLLITNHFLTYGAYCYRPGT